MRGSIIKYLEMCRAEDASLQRGMNFRLNGRHSVLLMSTRQGAPYRDRVEDEGATLIYEGHDVPRNALVKDPKAVDQLGVLPSGALTDNGKFFEAAQRYKRGEKQADVVRVYEKLRAGLWTDNGYFQLVDAWQEPDGTRKVFKFRLSAIESDDSNLEAIKEQVLPARTRLIPSAVKQEVWLRDQGKCCICGSADDLHFDHIIPYSKGGSSLITSNIQLLCARHNLEKRDKIE